MDELTKDGEMSKKALPPKLAAWVEARKRFKLSDAHIQMARELGMNPKKFGSKDNHDQEPWKVPLPEYIEHLYMKTFNRQVPDVVLSIEERHRRETAKKEAKRKERSLVEVQK